MTTLDYHTGGRVRGAARRGNGGGGGAARYRSTGDLFQHRNYGANE